MPNVFFTSDFHLGHHNIIRYCNRPFSSAAEMDDIIIQNLNYKVKKGDLLYFLGDFCLGRHEQVVAYRRRINCHNIIFIRGNHDKQIPSNCFSSIQDIGRYKSGDLQIYLCHYAMRVWNNSYHGSLHLFGHSHGTLSPYGKSFDCGVDANDFMPWSIDEVKERMESL